MEPKPLCFHETEGANNHIEQGDAFLFARHPVGVAYNQLPHNVDNSDPYIHSGRQGLCHIKLAY
jgi:hypothetical protein